MLLHEQANIGKRRFPDTLFSSLLYHFLTIDRYDEFESEERGSDVYTLQVGSFVLNGEILLIFTFGLAGWAALRSYARKVHLEEDIVTAASTGFLIWLLIWKGSLLLFDPAAVIQYPQALIFFDGGEKGRWTAWLAATGYIVARAWKGKLAIRTAAEAATVYLLGGLTAYHLGMSWFGLEVWPFHMAVSALTFFVLLSLFVTKRQVPWTGVMQRWLWLCIGLVGVGFINPDRKHVLLSFDYVQLICAAAAALLYLRIISLDRRSG